MRVSFLKSPIRLLCWKAKYMYSNSVPVIDVARAGEQRKNPKKIIQRLSKVIDSVIKKGWM